MPNLLKSLAPLLFVLILTPAAQAQVYGQAGVRWEPPNFALEASAQLAPSEKGWTLAGEYFADETFGLYAQYSQYDSGWIQGSGGAMLFADWKRLTYYGYLGGAIVSYKGITGSGMNVGAGVELTLSKRWFVRNEFDYTAVRELPPAPSFSSGLFVRW